MYKSKVFKSFILACTACLIVCLLECRQGLYILRINPVGGASGAINRDIWRSQMQPHTHTHTDIDFDHDRDLGHDLHPDVDFGDYLDPEFDLDQGFDLDPEFYLDQEFDPDSEFYLYP